MAGITDRMVRGLVVDAIKAGRRVTQADGTVPGLTMLVSGTGYAAWRFRYWLAGKHKAVAIGPYPKIAIAEAREIAAGFRVSVANGVDVAEEKQANKELAKLEKEEALLIAEVKALEQQLVQVHEWIEQWWQSASKAKRVALHRQWKERAKSGRDN
ncbi:integrase arm-type DNA-binding domain-containing protein [Dechloromonas sp. H13]|uniref:integrase arm-type DNA-binding domain-containing protein n=1 Tax=Dechloromonas sp. H13 TaxID=2570193 RepID=UPI001291D6B2|nr:integrase arm-type DNA-binding domain-containing protein [Dechloromonas sp. H13]